MRLSTRRRGSLGLPAKLRLHFRRRGSLGLPPGLRPPSRRRGSLGLPAGLRLASRRRGGLGLPAALLLAAGSATALAAQAGRAPARRAALEIEVADMDSAGRLCMRHVGAPPAPSTRVWLVQADTPQSVAWAAPANGRCASRPDRPEGPGVRLVPLRVLGGTLDSMRLSIGIVGPAREPTVLSGMATADLDGDGVAERFRACASSEGVHLTVWSGPPGRARLRWHRYFYLGYDVEPDCPESDIHDPTPGAALGRASSPTGQ